MLRSRCDSIRGYQDEAYRDIEHTVTPLHSSSIKCSRIGSRVWSISWIWSVEVMDPGSDGSNHGGFGACEVKDLRCNVIM